VCSNSRLVRQDLIEQKILSHVFGDLFAPHRLVYLERAVDQALRSMAEQAGDTKVQRDRTLGQARRELENIASAIRAGIITPTTKTMLEDAERRVAALEQAAHDARRRPAPVVSVQSVVERYLRDLRTTMETNVDEARRLLSLAVDKIVLRREGKRLIARVTGSLVGMFALEPDLLASVGAGSPSPALYSWPLATAAVA
jgi:site-specific DNA recombinase